MVKTKIHSSWGISALREDTRNFQNNLAKRLQEAGLNKTLFGKCFKGNDKTRVKIRNLREKDEIYQLTEVYLESASNTVIYQVGNNIIVNELKKYNEKSGIVITGPGFIN